MTIGKTLALTAGFAGAMALGMAIGTSWMDRDRTAPVVVEQPADVAPAAAAAEPAKPARSARSRAAAKPETTPSAPPVAAVSPTDPELQLRLKKVLNRGADVSIAADGFKNGEQFATVAYASRNTEVPFMLLKHRVLVEGMTLEQAILESKPVIDITTELARAQAAARADVAALGN
jgi:hypothetical protein